MEGGIATQHGRIPVRIERVNSTSVLAGIVGVVESLRPTLVPRNTRHQGLVTTSVTATMAAVGAVLPAAPWWSVPTLALVAVPRVRYHLRAQRRSYPDWDPRPQNTAVSIAVGAGSGLAFGSSPALLARGFGSLGAVLARRRGGSAPGWALAAAGATALGVAGLASASGKVGLARLTQIGTAADSALCDPPEDDHVSGGPKSLIDYDSLARDGRRFVSLRTPAGELVQFGPAREPIRVYVGINSAQGVSEQVDLAMSELDRLDAWSRSTLLVMAPSGSGYADYVAVESVEALTAGDCASVVIQYGVWPSMLSLRRVVVGVESLRGLLDRILQRCEQMSEPPKVVMYGESLGARVAQEALTRQPCVVTDDGDVPGVAAVVSIGTPGGASLRNDMLANPATVHLDRWQQMRGRESATLWFVDHDADPVTKWDGALAWRDPAWLRRKVRGRNVPDDMAWFPVLTWWQVIFDLVYAAQQQSGVFRSIGHDYRADVAPVMAAALATRPAPDLVAIGAHLARREVDRDQLLQAQSASSLENLPESKAIQRL